MLSAPLERTDVYDFVNYFRIAKDKRLRIWKDFKASESKGVKLADKSYTAKV